MNASRHVMNENGKAEQQGKAKRLQSTQSKAKQRNATAALHRATNRPPDTGAASACSGQERTGLDWWTRVARKRLDRTGQDRQAAGMEMMGWDGLGEGESAGAWCWLAAVGVGMAWF